MTNVILGDGIYAQRQADKLIPRGLVAGIPQPTSPLLPSQKRFQSPPLVCNAIRVYRLAVKKPSTIMNKTHPMDRTSDFSL